ANPPPSTQHLARRSAYMQLLRGGLASPPERSFAEADGDAVSSAKEGALASERRQRRRRKAKIYSYQLDEELAARPVAGELAHSGCPQSARRLPSKCTPAARLLQSRLEGFGIEREYDSKSSPNHHR
ncbi:unnamed protein product, partial [Effrenium voratum]